MSDELTAETISDEPHTDMLPSAALTTIATTREALHDAITAAVLEHFADAHHWGFTLSESDARYIAGDAIERLEKNVADAG